jgi:acylglycerol lipase
VKSFELNWKSKDGLDLFGRAWEPMECKPKAVICHVHGLGEHSGRYVHAAQAFTKACHIMLSFDLRGHGCSGGARGHLPSFDSYLDDVDVLLEQARSRYPGLPLLLYGHSLGGTIVLGHGLKRKPDVSGVIATGSALHTALELQPVKKTLVRVLGALMPNASMPSGLDVNMLSHDPSVIKAYVNDPLVHNKVTLGFGRNMLDAVHYILDHAAEFPLPLLMVHGKEDVIAFPSSSIEFAAPLMDKCTLMLWDGLYHEVHNEPEKDKVLNAMILWMDARLA